MSRATRGVGALAAALGVMCALAACVGPPPALPASVMAQGADAVPEEHPEMTEAQLAACGECHLTSDEPADSKQ